MKLKNLLSYLRALSTLYQHEHWKSEGTSFFGDHLMYERLYSNIPGELDMIAEKCIGLEGDKEIEPKEDTEEAQKYMKDIVPESLNADNFAETSIKAERKLLEMIAELMEDKPSDGVQNMLQGIADKHEGHIYLLQQRKSANFVSSLIKLANDLDDAGLYDEANDIDKILNDDEYKDIITRIIMEKEKKERDEKYKPEQLQIEEPQDEMPEEQPEEPKSDRGVVVIDMGGEDDDNGITTFDMACESSVIPRLYKLAYNLDQRGLYSEADKITAVMQNMAERAGLDLDALVVLADTFDAEGNTVMADYFDEMIKSAKDKARKPPKKWWDKMVKQIKKTNPDYSEKQIAKTIGKIWFSLDKKMQKKILGREGKKL